MLPMVFKEYASQSAIGLLIEDKFSDIWLGSNASADIGRSRPHAQRVAD